jgi:hypothetical protein
MDLHLAAHSSLVTGDAAFDIFANRSIVLE